MQEYYESQFMKYIFSRDFIYNKNKMVHFKIIFILPLFKKIMIYFSTRYILKSQFTTPGAFLPHPLSYLLNRRGQLTYPWKLEVYCY